MGGFKVFAERGIVSEEFSTEVGTSWLRKSRILIVVDGIIAVWPDPGPVIGQEFGFLSTAFGISTAIATLRGFSSGFSSFAVTVATREGDGSPKLGHDITGFRFSDASLAGFDQVWMFGINPGNVAPDSTDPADDARIEEPIANPVTDEELAALAKWMDSGGGVFATGDHHFLGASMCHKVPRVSTMRRWTIADGVPTQHHPTRYDTNRPANSAQLAGSMMIPTTVETDFVPQRIEWVPYARLQLVLAFRTRPHPLLCHPTLGPIDILPDHPHEGLCYDFSASSWQLDKRDLTFSFAGYSNDHYPAANGQRPLPQVVAWGTTLADPPLWHQKDDQPQRRFPQIAAYDGQAIGIGRVVVDATWHHWFDMNLAGMEEHARETGDRNNIDRILRYFVNVGVYLASPTWRAGMIYGALKEAQLGYFGQEEADLTASAADLGRDASAHLNPLLGSCWMTETVLDHVRAVDGDAWLVLKAMLAEPGRGRASLSYELVEQAVLGELVRALYSDMDEFRAQIAQRGVISWTPLFGNIDRVAVDATRRGLKAALDAHAQDLDRGRKDLAQFARRGKYETEPQPPPGEPERIAVAEAD